MGNWFSSLSSSPPATPAPTLTSIQPLPGAEDSPPPPSPPSYRPPSSSASTPDDSDSMYTMYRGRNYRRRFNDLHDRNRRRRYNRFSRRNPWYTIGGRWRPSASERDRAFFVSLDDDNTSRYPYSGHTEEPEEVKPEIPREELRTKLTVKSVDLHIKDNAESHRTDSYACVEARKREVDGKDVDMPPELVIRRGQEFKMTIEFDRPYDIKKNDITLVFNFGDDHKKHKNLSATIRVDDGDGRPSRPNQWKANKISGRGNSLTVQVFVPAFVAVGEWQFGIKTYVGERSRDEEKDDRLTWQYNHNEEINVLFNPWCKEDWVYMSDKDWREEAVMNDNGAVYRGSKYRIGAKSWFFGQFDDEILDAAFHLLRKAFDGKSVPSMGNAAEVSRQISKIVNSPDDLGVLEGNWSGDYEGGESPSSWGSSARILKLYMEHKKPVKYGQCWVFSALTTTVCRALGMPCRSVTNFASAHNTDDLLSIDIYQHVGEDGDPVEVKNDSVWNFHVWNEVWMCRPDLDEKGTWDGWQVIDATPQEHSDGVFCCGPAPVKAIKEGEITIGKDTEFVFAEVNADRVTWAYDEYGHMYQVSRKRNTIGMNISTHSPSGRGFRGGSIGNARTQERLDLTLDYKYKEGSSKEKETVRKAERKFQVMKCGVVEDEEESPDIPAQVEISIKDPGDVFIGSAVNFDVTVKNIKGEAIVAKSVIIKIFYKTYFDTNLGLAVIKKVKDVEFKAGEEKSFQLELDVATSMAKPQHGFYFDVNACASFYDSPRCTEEIDFRYRLPDVQIKGPEKYDVYRPLEVEISFVNPFSVYLTECEVNLDGGFNFRRGSDKIKVPDIKPNGRWEQKISIRPNLAPYRKVDRELSVTFKSRQLQDIMGYYAVERA